MQKWMEAPFTADLLGKDKNSGLYHSELEYGDIKIKHSLWVAQCMAFAVVMGRDALRRINAVIDCGKMTAKMDGVEINLYGPLTRKEANLVKVNIAAQSTTRLSQRKW
jgi:hypothetical protein